MVIYLRIPLLSAQAHSLYSHSDIGELLLDNMADEDCLYNSIAASEICR